MNTESAFRPSRADRVGMIAFLLLGAAVVALSATQSFTRISQVLSRSDVPMSVSFVDQSATLAFGNDAAPLRLQLDSAHVIVPALPESAVGPAVLQSVIQFGTVLTVLACLVLLTARFFRGRIFGRGNTALVATAGMVGLVGSGTAAALGGAAGVEALGSVSDGGALALFVLDPGPFIIGAFAFAVILTAFAVGARIQRETEGLV